MADNESTEVLKEVVKNNEPSDEEHHVDEADHKYSDHEGLIKKLFNYNSTLDAAVQFPSGLLKAVIASKDSIAHRFVIVDNSSSTIAKDCHQLAGKGEKMTNAKCSRWDEISGIAKSIAYLSDASETPAEFRLLNLNKEKVVKVGQSNDEGKSLARAIALLSEAPRADTPICKAVNEIVVKMKAMEDNLRANDQYALVIILTDGESTDGDVIAALKQLEGLSVQIVIRVATDDNVVIEYWNKVNVAIDINALVLDEFDCEASQIEEVNGWLTYGAALHRAREYGVVLPFMDNVDYCQLSQADITSVVQMLVFDNEPVVEGEEWITFIDRLKAAKIPEVFSVTKKCITPLVDVKALSEYKKDTLQAVLDRNEEVLRKIYITYAFDKTLMPQETLVDCKSLGIVPNYNIRSVRVATEKTIRSGEGYTPLYARGQVANLKSKAADAQISRYNTRFEKKDMHEDAFLKLLTDFDLVPAVINKVRFEKFMAAISEKRRYYTVRIHTCLTFKDFKKTLIKISQVNFPKYSKPKKLLVVLQKMSASGQLAELEKTKRIVLREDESVPFVWPVTAANAAAAEE